MARAREAGAVGDGPSAAARQVAAAPAARRSRLAGQRRPAGQDGMTTAEYAVGTVAACGFAGVLFKLLTSESVVRMLKDIVERALTVAF